jgi:hypothetical protein
VVAVPSSWQVEMVYAAVTVGVNLYHILRETVPQSVQLSVGGSPAVVASVMSGVTAVR